jgi:hypothetical protein
MSKSKVYCVSKLKLATMARNRETKFNGINIDPEFVNSFSSYTDYSVDELQKRTTIISQIIKYYYDNDKLLYELAKEYNLFGYIDISAELENHLRHQLDIEITDELKNIVQKQLELIASDYVNSLLLVSANKYIESNLQTLISEYNNNYKKLDIDDIDWWKVYDQSKLIQESLYPIMDNMLEYISHETVLIINSIDKYALALVLQERIKSTPSDLSSFSEEVVRSQDLVCDTCRRSITQPVALKTVSHELGLDIAESEEVSFCSITCLNKKKFTELTSNDLRDTKVVAMISKILTPYLTFNQLRLIASFSPAINRKYQKDKLDQYIQSIANLENITVEQAQQYISESNSKVNLDAYALSIPIENNITYNELWDKIKIHPKFTPSSSELLKDDKFEALQYLANHFDVILENKEFYEDNPLLLKQVWFNLRRDRTFEKYLNYTIKSFNPEQTKTSSEKRIEDSQNINIDAVVNGQLDTTIEKYFATQLRSRVNELKTLLNSRNDFLKFSKEQRKQAFKTLFIRGGLKHMFVNMEDTNIYKEMIAKLKIIFLAVQQSILAKRNIIKDDNYNEAIAILLPYINSKCSSDIDEIKLTKWTRNILINNPSPERVVFERDYYIVFLKTFRCRNLSEIADRIQSFNIVQKKIENILDKVIVNLIVLQDQAMKLNQREELGKSQSKMFNKRRHPKKQQQDFDDEERKENNEDINEVNIDNILQNQKINKNTAVVDPAFTFQLPTSKMDIRTLTVSQIEKLRTKVKSQKSNQPLAIGEDVNQFVDEFVPEEPLDLEAIQEEIEEDGELNDQEVEHVINDDEDENEESLGDNDYGNDEQEDVFDDIY